ncbi:cinnamyl alcohol dehydrogenase [Raphidocelis subcapitata]|uniref:Cinnamyl alcohol dehydrogenase n=1 Tax=Raphidocelis subcapitata TaxID=307507 RepID=A0A2V0PLM7_9CHLO|nr:cinnamyl alcohol dehydrogenase [Raphidocelis subcapitata]|eukprot:GBG00450.1 cinnamyl alcohol dehydrogenase [Raphidocelis subcapitata]
MGTLHSRRRSATAGIPAGGRGPRAAGAGAAAAPRPAAALRCGGVPEGAWTICDVRDVAAAHVAAAENPDAAGRYIVSQPGSIDARFVTDALKGALPGAAALPDGPRTATKETIDASKVRTQLGIELHPAAQTIADGAASLLEHGLAAPAWAAKGAAAKVPAAAF